MNMRSACLEKCRRNWLAATVAALLGALLVLPPFGNRFLGFSHDVLELMAPGTSPPEAILVLLDAQSAREMKQEAGSWDRALHGRLLERLSTDPAELIGMDILFARERETESDGRLSAAMRQHGSVFLASAIETSARPGLTQNVVVHPAQRFREAAAGAGFASFELGSDGVVRTWLRGDKREPDLPTVMATRVGRSSRSDQAKSLFLNYYGPPGTIASIRYAEAFAQAPSFFRGKTVFVGAGPDLSAGRPAGDVFRTPFSAWGASDSAGVEILATAYLNLIRNEYFRRPPLAIEALLAALAAAASAIVLRGSNLRSLFLRTFVVSGCALLIGLYAGHSLWLLNWAGMTAAPLLCAVGYFTYCLRSSRLQRVLVSEASPENQSGKALEQGAEPQCPKPPAVSDHRILSRIGRGGYGEVWLARNIVGGLAAVKVIRRDAFADAEPYEREFRGISQFMPISSEHPNLVRILHAGRSADDHYFFYVMEAADDIASGSSINVDRYCAMTLSRRIKNQGRLPSKETIHLGIQLASGLAFLHSRRLIHRDIKPANIIYVKGVPKIADIGLITKVFTDAKPASYLGTEGYIPPEGPGSPSADIYSLGKVLYEAATGLSCGEFPALPTPLIKGDQSEGWILLNEVILKACESDNADRFATAADMGEALSRIQLGGSSGARFR